MLYEAFQRFLQSKHARIASIARATDREHDVGDVENEAWLMAATVSQKLGMPIDFDNPAFQDYLIAFLYNELVKYGEKVVRYAVKLDKPIDGEDIGWDSHPALYQAAVDQESDPLAQLCAQEDQETEPVPPPPHESLIGAYYHLLSKLGNMRSMAEYLLISLSYCYHRRKVSLIIDKKQMPLPSHGLETTSASTPKTWRPFRLHAPVQLELPIRQWELQW